MKIYFRILKYARPLGILIPQYIIYTFLSVTIGIMNLAIMIPLLKVLFNTEEVENKKYLLEYPEFSLDINYIIDLFYYYFQQIISEFGALGALYFICIMVVTATLLSNIFKYLANIVVTLLKLNVIKNLRGDFYNKILRFDLSYLASTRKGDIISRGTSDILEIENSVINSFSSLIKEPFTIIGLFYVLFLMNAELTLYTFILLPIAGILISKLVKKLKSYAVDKQDTLGQIGTVLDECISGIRVIKAFGMESYFQNKFKEKIHQFGLHNLKIAKTTLLAPSVSEVLGASTLALLLLIGGQMIFRGDGSMNAAEFIGFIILFSQILKPSTTLANGLSLINKGIASGERIFSVLDEKINIPENVNGKPFTTLHDKIEFQNIYFAYEKKEILKSINFSINKGEIVALVGASGGGKSTIADLLPRFYDPKAGSIHFDGIDLRNFQIANIRKNMGIVTQESILFHDTVFNNIAFGKKEAKKQEVIAAAKVANAHEFIEKMTHGYNTLIGERGTKLSGGQRQRLTIARAVIKNPSILILDEATSALDSESEKLVQDAIFKLMQNRTTLVIAHRLSTIQNAHKILVVFEGQVVQEGTHKSLVKKDGMYKKLLSMQSFTN